PDRDLNRLTTFFRIFAVIPIAIVLFAVSGGSTYSWAARDETYAFSAGAGGILFFGPLLLIVFRQKYPRWWFDWNLNLARFENRVISYLLLLRDEYPSTDEEQSVRLDFPYPDARNGLNRWLPLVKWLLAIPHYVVLVFLSIAAFVCVIVAWFAILFTGRYPRGIFDFVEGVIRWWNRVAAYAFVLVTDRYPPFSLSA
ncbi:MAG: DUF4389 domain-containing protein, partial [Gaiellaceae bacterium]